MEHLELPFLAQVVDEMEHLDSIILVKLVEGYW
jgi:hypothetical protein